MRLRTINFIILAVFITCGQPNEVDRLDKKRLEIDELVSRDKDRLLVLVKRTGKESIEKVLNQNWPDSIETTYNIYRDNEGHVIYLGEFPTIESGDWVLGFKHYFSNEGQLIGLERSLSYFSEDCLDVTVREKQIELFDRNFNVIQTTFSLTDTDGKPLTG